jgi:translation initiation factor IF-1
VSSGFEPGLTLFFLASRTHGEVLFDFPSECRQETEHFMGEAIVVEGTVVTVLPSTLFRVELDNQHRVLAHVCGKMRKRFIRLTVGDRVRMEMSPYDVEKARIVYRLR